MRKPKKPVVLNVAQELVKKEKEIEEIVDNKLKEIYDYHYVDMSRTHEQHLPSISEYRLNSNV